MPLKVAVIGAGAAGLACARRLEEGKRHFSYDVYEQSDVIGGTWVYSEATGADEYGYPIHTSMYCNLRTNLPKEVMAFPDMDIEQADCSYVPAAVVLQYLRTYARCYNLNQHIKLSTRVLTVAAVKEDAAASGGPSKWAVTSVHLPSRARRAVLYDAVMVCNGHYHTGRWGGEYIPGVDKFSGQQLHSHDYRDPRQFAGLVVVVVGAGPSGLDIALDLSHHASQVYLSHHLKELILTHFPANLTHKPDISAIDENATKMVVFADGTTVEADVILYCTGYIYNFPFLDKRCGVTVDDNYVAPLFKHVIAINNPTLAFIGLPFYVCANAMFDLQARFFLASLLGTYQLPSREEMLKDERDEMEKRRAMGFSRKRSHEMGPLQGEYYESMSTAAGIAGIPPVMTALHNESSRRFLEDLVNFRNDRYTIIDANTFKLI